MHSVCFYFKKWGSLISLVTFLIITIDIIVKEIKLNENQIQDNTCSRVNFTPYDWRNDATTTCK
jgi:hypothetical protein